MKPIRYSRVAGGALAFFGALIGIAVILDRFGVSEPQWKPRTVLHWTLTNGVNVVLILVVAVLVVRAANLAIARLQAKLEQRHADTDHEWRRRASTLSAILTRLVAASVGFVAVLMVLRELAIDIAPILTGAGIVGLAVGFGAQNLVRDVISGFFMILEDQVRIGDAARINGIGGSVEQINLRTVVLRDGEGAVHVFPNGTITSLSNLSKHYAYAVVDTRINYGENIDRVFGAAHDVGVAMAKDPAWAPLLLAPLEIVGIESLADGAVTIRVKFKTVPLSHGRVAGELRKRLLAAFISLGIKPYAG